MHREAIANLYEKEAAKLNVKLPIMMAITRREFLKHRLYECDDYDDLLLIV